MNELKNGKKFSKLILYLLLLLLVGGYLTTTIVKTTFASGAGKEPNVFVIINKDGSITQEGSLFGEGLLYPATVEEAEKGIGSISGIIRIKNQYGKIKVTSLGVTVDKEKVIIGNGYPRDVVYNSFLKNVELKIDKGKFHTFDKTIVGYTCLGDLLGGYRLDENDVFTLNKGGTLDLKYTLRMDEETGNELQSVTADIMFLINVNENQEESEHWAHDCIITLLNNGVIIGYPHDKYTIEDYFKKTVDPAVYVNKVVLPERFITRAETAVLVGRALGLKEDLTAKLEYKDYIPTWAKGYIAATTKEKIFEGYPSGEFKPNNHITREEMITVLTKAFDVKLENKRIELPFKDKDQIGHWALEYVKAGYEKEIIVGYPDNTYKPKRPITRAEAFTIICKLKGWHIEHSE